MSEPRPDRDPDAPDAPEAERPTADGLPGPSGDGEGDRSDPFDCSYCDRRFAREDWLALHEGLDHESTLSPDERAAYEAARETEEERLRLFRYKALGALVLLYFGFIVLYAVSL